jgi:uncharacterized protein (TIGR03083 family)
MALPAIDVVDLFPDERAALLEVLESLTPEEWELATVCPGWSVKDIALHLLGDEVGMISSWRDGFRNPHFADGLDISTWDGLLAAIDRQNVLWVGAMRRMSAPLLIQLLRFTSAEMVATLRTIDPNQLSGPVDWAGPEPAPAWLQFAREYTEYWIHQQQIRDATGRPGLTDRRRFHPVLDAFARAIPHALRNTAATSGTTVRLVITGEAGGTWTVVHGDRWEFLPAHPTADTTVTMDQDIAWRLFTKGIRPDDIRDQITIDGDPALAEPLLQMVTILA